jgi:hypothetical protein
MANREKLGWVIRAAILVGMITLIAAELLVQ